MCVFCMILVSLLQETFLRNLNTVLKKESDKTKRERDIAEEDEEPEASEGEEQKAPDKKKPKKKSPAAAVPDTIELRLDASNKPSFAHAVGRLHKYFAISYYSEILVSLALMRLRYLICVSLTRGVKSQTASKLLADTFNLTVPGGSSVRAHIASMSRVFPHFMTTGEHMSTWLTTCSKLEVELNRHIGEMAAAEKPVIDVDIVKRPIKTLLSLWSKTDEPVSQKTSITAAINGAIAALKQLNPAKKTIKKPDDAEKPKSKAPEPRDGSKRMRSRENAGLSAELRSDDESGSPAREAKRRKVDGKAVPDDASVTVSPAQPDAASDSAAILHYMQPLATPYSIDPLHTALLRSGKVVISSHHALDVVDLLRTIDPRVFKSGSFKKASTASFAPFASAAPVSGQVYPDGPTMPHGAVPYVAGSCSINLVETIKKQWSSYSRASATDLPQMLRDTAHKTSLAPMDLPVDGAVDGKSFYVSSASGSGLESDAMNALKEKDDSLFRDETRIALVHHRFPTSTGKPPKLMHDSFCLQPNSIASITRKELEGTDYGLLYIKRGDKLVVARPHIEQLGMDFINTQLAGETHWGWIHRSQFNLFIELLSLKATSEKRVVYSIEAAYFLLMTKTFLPTFEDMKQHNINVVCHTLQAGQTISGPGDVIHFCFNIPGATAVNTASNILTVDQLRDAKLPKHLADHFERTTKFLSTMTTKVFDKLFPTENNLRADAFHNHAPHSYTCDLLTQLLLVLEKPTGEVQNRDLKNLDLTTLSQYDVGLSIHWTLEALHHLHQARPHLHDYCTKERADVHLCECTKAAIDALDERVTKSKEPVEVSDIMEAGIGRWTSPEEDRQHVDLS
jgi:hypothetical protein